MGCVNRFRRGVQKQAMSLEPSISLFCTFPRQRFVASAKLGSFLGSAFTGISDMIALVGGEGLASGVMMLIPI